MIGSRSSRHTIHLTFPVERPVARPRNSPVILNVGPVRERRADLDTAERAQAKLRAWWFRGAVGKERSYVGSF
jgi:hypothetical protein